MADPALGLKLKLQVDDTALPAEVARAKAKVDAIAASTDAEVLPMPEGGIETYGQFLERKRAVTIAAQKKEQAELLAADERFEAEFAARKAAKAESQRVADIARETGGKFAGAVNPATAEFAKLDDSLKGIRKRFTDSTQEAMKWLGVAGLIAGTATTFYAVGNAIYSGITHYLETGTDRAKAFRDSLDLTDAAASVKAYDDELASLDASMAERSAGTVKGWVASLWTSDAKLQEEINQKRQDRQRTQEQAQAKKRYDDRVQERKKEQQEQEQAAKERQQKEESERRKKQEDDKRAAEEFLKATDEAQVDALMDSLDEQQRIRAESARKIFAIEDKFATLNKADQIANESALNDAREAIRKDEIRRLDEYAKNQEKAAQKVRDAWSNSFRQIREENNRAFATDQAASMVQFAQQLRIEGAVAQANMNRIVVEGVG